MCSISQSQAVSAPFALIWIKHGLHERFGDGCRIECRSKLALQNDGSADAEADRKTVSIGWFRTSPSKSEIPASRATVMRCFRIKEGMTETAIGAVGHEGDLSRA
jgi:hypothetical protein